MDLKDPGVDYFSSIPDALILIILTFLPFGDAVRTSVLSRRWRYFWLCTRTVDLDQNLFGNSRDLDVQRSNLMVFISRWVHIYREPFVDTFRLVVPQPPETSVPLLQRCIEFSVHERRVRSIELDFSSPVWDKEDDNLGLYIPRRQCLPLNLNSFNTIPETLVLSAFDLRIPEYIPLLNIKNLYLGWTELRGYIHKISSLCPLLETLTLKRCWNLGYLDINLERLRVLVVDKCLSPRRVSAIALVMEYFKYCGGLCDLEIKGNPKLREAVLELAFEIDWDKEIYPEMLLDTLEQIGSNRSFVTVCSYTLQFLPILGNLLMLKQSFAAVTRLCLMTQLHVKEYYGITFLLNCCPKVEILSIEISQRRIIEDYESPYRIEDHPFLSGSWHPRCLENKLKTLKVRGFTGAVNEEVVLKYLLKYGKVLETFAIYVDGKDEGQTYVGNIRRVLQHGVCSPSLKLHVAKEY